MAESLASFSAVDDVSVTLSPLLTSQLTYNIDFKGAYSDIEDQPLLAMVSLAVCVQLLDDAVEIRVLNNMDKPNGD